MKVLLTGAAGQLGHHARHALGIGTRGDRLFLGAAQLGRRHHLHRRRDLPRRLDAVDPDLEVLEAGHAALSLVLLGADCGPDAGAPRPIQANVRA